MNKKDEWKWYQNGEKTEEGYLRAVNKWGLYT